MRRLLLLWILLILAPTAHAQDDYPPLVGPIVYFGNDLSGTNVFQFQDIGADAVWTIDGVADIGFTRVWSSDGCHVLYGGRNRSHYAILDIQRRTTTDVFDLLAGFDDDATIYGQPKWSPDGLWLTYTVSNGGNTASVVYEIATGDTEILPEFDDESEIVGVPLWSPDGLRLAYAVYNRGDTAFVAYEIATGETEILYTREDFDPSFEARLVEWPQDNILIYNHEGYWFEVDLVTEQIRFVPRDVIVNFPLRSQFEYALQSPNNSAIARYFDLRLFFYTLDERYGQSTQAERDAIRQVVVPSPGLEIYSVNSGETVSFDLDGQVVRNAAWSPDGSHLAVVTRPINNDNPLSGAYIYTHETRTIAPLRDVRPIPHSNTASFPPQWSSDSTWITVNSQNHGWIAYNLADEIIIPITIPAQISSVSGTIPFSPVTHYEAGACG